MRQEPFDLRRREPLRLHLGLRFRGGLAAHQRLGLREAVREHDRVVLRQMVVRLAAHDEIGGHDLRALVQHLIERVLPVRAGRAPDDGT